MNHKNRNLRSFVFDNIEPFYKKQLLQLQAKTFFRLNTRIRFLYVMAVLQICKIFLVWAYATHFAVSVKGMRHMYANWTWDSEEYYHPRHLGYDSLWEYRKFLLQTAKELGDNLGGRGVCSEVSDCSFCTKSNLCHSENSYESLLFIQEELYALESNLTKLFI